MITPKIEFQDIEINTPTKVGVMLEVTAPEAMQNLAIAPRKPQGIVFVIDRSGSMGGGRLDIVKNTVSNFLGLFDSNDYLSVVTFDGTVCVDLPMSRIGDLVIPDVRKIIANITLGGSTNLEAGYRAGLAEAISGPTGMESTVFLLSDGHANNGVSDPEELGQLAAAATEHYVKTSSIGIGDAYDERALVALSNTGRGDHFAAITLDEAVQGLNAQVDSILNRTISNLTLSITGEGQFSNLRSRTSQYVVALKNQNGGSDVVLGDLGSLEERNFVFEVELGAAEQVSIDGALTLRWSYLDLTTGQEHSGAKRFELKVVDEADWVEPARDEDIALELAALRAEDAKEEAIRLMRLGQDDEARRVMADAGVELEQLEQSLHNVSPRNRRRNLDVQSEMMMFASMSKEEFIKRGEESLKRGRESKPDPRKPRTPKPDQDQA